jgi:D-lactate dehydrogenase
VAFVSRAEIFERSDILTLHCPLTAETHHLIDEDSLAHVKPGIMLINTGRGALIDTRAVIRALKDRTIGYLGLDVYEEEEELFYEDLSAEIIQDDVFMRLLTFPNVLVTAHQAFFTDSAMSEIAETTLQNVSDFEAGRRLKNEVAA